MRPFTIKHTPVIGITASRWLLTKSDVETLPPKPFAIKALADVVKQLSTACMCAHRFRCH
ncbi:MAG: hypothetical protein QNI92_11750 [Desulfobacterales bacterium]|nr:hypothetical protein [Desulfobacterales bacterium]